jgi:DNA-binding NtrC family response regulator
MNVLIVDDDAEDAEMLREAVNESTPRADCRIVQTAEDARNIVGQFTPQIIFFDVVMYPVGGQEILREFAELPLLQNCRFIVISGIILPQHYREFIALGAHVIMEKPASYESLLRFVKQTIAASELTIRAKIFTSDLLVHGQITSLESLLERKIDFEIALNVKPILQNIQFYASEIELRKIKSELGYNLLLFSGGHWLPNI